MNGFSGAVGIEALALSVEIFIERDKYNIGRYQFDRKDATDPALENLTNGVIDVFQALEKKSRRSLHLSKADCRAHLAELADFGQTAYDLFFDAERSRKLLSLRFRKMSPAIPNPTFVSESLPFPWEVLYEGPDCDNPDPQMFWGFRYAPARILDVGKDVLEHVDVQERPSDMLFALHHRLRQAHKVEWPEIEQIVKLMTRGRFNVLCTSTALGEMSVCDDGSFLSYLYQANHNMLHFACHCQEGEYGDVLLVSLLDEQNGYQNSKMIHLKTRRLTKKKQFNRAPLIFMNACQSAGGADPLRKTFNFPKLFAKRGAAAIIATACPMPDHFAAAFARVFYEHFLKKNLPLGEALRLTRYYFLETYNNPLGLAYGLYSPAHYRLAQVPAARE